MTPLCDAHNHLHDPRLAPFLEDLIPQLREAGIIRCVVNGTCEEDWPRVANLARRFPDLVQPSFGLHPWKAPNRSPHWMADLTEYLDAFPLAGLGECGLDRWIPDHDLGDQRAVFLAQLEIAAAQNRPLSIHCLKAWGPLLDCLRAHPLPARGFLLHSYGGSPELVAELAPLGARFSFSGCFLHPRKESVRRAFQHMPLDRILAETDAPDMLPPPEHRPFSLPGAGGADLNHPANLRATVHGLGEFLDTGHESLETLLSANHSQFFESWIHESSA